MSALQWNYIGVFAKVLAQLGIGITLARLLGPKPFGVYSVVLLTSGIAALLVDRGLGSALVQSPTLTEAKIRYAFTQLLIMGITTAVLLCILAPLVKALFRYPGLNTAIYGSALYLFVYSLGVVPGALLQRDLNMKTFQIAQVTAYLIGYGIVGILGAVYGLGAWSLIAALVTQWTVFMLIAYARVRHPLRPLLRCQDDRLATFGRLVVGTNLMNWTIENTDNLVVGRVFGMSALGMYSVSYNLVRTVTNHIMTTAQGVLFPAASRVQDDIHALQKAYLTVLSGVLLVLCPIFFGSAAVAQTIVQGVYGHRWDGAEAFLVPLALAMPVHATITGSVLLWARGKVATELKVESGTAAAFVCALFVASRYSAQAVAWAVLSVYILRALWLTSNILQCLELPWRAFWKAARGGFYLGVITAVTLFGVNEILLAEGVTAGPRLVIAVLTGIAIVSILPMRIRSITGCDELRSFVTHATARTPRFVRTVMQFYVGS